MNEYYYLDAQNQQQGPVSPTQFGALGVTASTYVWCAGMEQWKPAGEIPELTPYLTPVHQQTPPQHPGYQGGYGQQGTYNPNNFGNNGPIMIPPQSYLVWAILATLFCCLPFGIVAIVYASQVDTEWSRGNYDGAYNKSRQARNWVIASAACGLAFALIYVILMVCGILGASSSAIYY